MNGSSWKALKQIRDCKGYIKYVKKNQDKLVLSLDEREMVEGWLEIANDIQGDLNYDVSTLEAVHAEILNMSKRFPGEIDEDEDNADPWGSDDSVGVGFKFKPEKDDLGQEEMLRNPHYQTAKDGENLNGKGSAASATPPPTPGRGTTSGIRVGVQNAGNQRPYFGRGRGFSTSNCHVKSPGPGPVPMTLNQSGTSNPPYAATPSSLPMNGHNQSCSFPQPQPFNGHPHQMYNVPVPLHPQLQPLNGQAFNIPLHPQSQPLNGQAHNVPLHPPPQMPNSQYNFPHRPQQNDQHSFPTATYIPTGASGNGTQMNHNTQFVFNNHAPAPVDPRLNSQTRPGQPYYAPRVQPNGMSGPPMQQQTFAYSSNRVHVMSPSPPMPPEYEPAFVPEPQPGRASYSTTRTSPVPITSQSNQGQPQRTTYRHPTYQNYAANRHDSSGGNSFRPNGQLGKFGKPNRNPQIRRPQNSSRPFSANNNFGSNNGSSDPSRNGRRPTTASTQQSTLPRKTPSSSAVRASLEMNTEAQDNTINSNNIEDMEGAEGSDGNSAGEGKRIPLKKNSRAFHNVTKWRKSLVEQSMKQMYRLGTKSKNNVVEVSKEAMSQPSENLQPEPAKKTTKTKKATARKTTNNSFVSQRKPTTKVPAKRTTISREDEDDDGESADDFKPEKRGPVKVKLPFNNNTNKKKPTQPKSKETEEPIAHCSKSMPTSRAQPASKPNKKKSKAAPKPSQPKNSPAKRSRKPLIIYSDEEEEAEQMLDPYRILIASEQLEEVRPIPVKECGMYKIEDILPYLKILVLEFRKARTLEAASKFLEKPTNFQRFLTSVAALLDEAIDPELMRGQGVPAELCVRAEQPQGRVLRARCIPNELKLTPTFVKYLEHVHKDWWLPTVASAQRKEADAASNSQQTRKRSGSTTKDDAKKAKNVDQKSTANKPDSSNGSSKNGSIEDDVNGSQEQLGNGAVKQESEEYAIPENVLAGSGIDTMPAPVIPPTNAPLTTAGPQGTTENVQVVVKTEIKMELDDSDYDELPAEVLANLNLVPDV